eukprot:gene10786-biopygen7465
MNEGMWCQRHNSAKVRRAVNSRGSANRGCGRGGKALRPLHTALRWGRPNIVATLLALRARIEEKDERGLTAHGVAVEVDSFIKGTKSRSLAVSLPNKEIWHVEVTSDGVKRSIRILGDDPSSESDDEFS